MYCNKACSAAEPKEICLQCFNRHLKSRCSRRMRLLREKQISKGCECSCPRQGQQPFLGAESGLCLPCMLAKHSKVSHSSRKDVHMETGQGTEQETALSSWVSWCMYFSAKHRDQRLLLSFRYIHSLQPSSHSCQENLFVGFMLYLVMGQD